MYRLFGRAKTVASIQHKIGLKGESYRSGKQKINDIIGLRIVVYFPDDVDVLAMYFDDNTVVKRHIPTPTPSVRSVSISPNRCLRNTLMISVQHCLRMLPH